MKRPDLKLSVFGALALLVCASCSSGDDDGISVTTNWLGPLRHFERLSGGEGFGVFLKNDPSIPASVRELRIGPAEITISPNSDLNALEPAPYERLRAGFADALRRHIAGGAPAGTDQKDGETYVLHAALTNLTVTRKTREFGPVGLENLEFSLEGAAIEISLHQQSTNMRRAVIVQRAAGGKVAGNDLTERFNALAIEAAKTVAEARNGINRKASQPPPPPAKATPPGPPEK